MFVSFSFAGFCFAISLAGFACSQRSGATSPCCARAGLMVAGVRITAGAGTLGQPGHRFSGPHITSFR